MTRTTETRSFIFLAAAAALFAATCASLITVWVATYESEPAKPESQLFGGVEAEALAQLGVERLEVKKIHSMGAKPVFQLKLHQAGKVTGYRGFYPDTVDMVIDVASDGLAKAEYTGSTLEEFHEDHLRQIGEFFLVKGIDVAKRLQAFDGTVLGKNSVAAAGESAVRE